MVDVAFQSNRTAAAQSGRRRVGLRNALRRKSMSAFLMTLPLILLIAVLVIYPAIYSLHLATLNKAMTKFVGFGNFEFLFKRDTFWLVVKQSCIFAISAVIFKALIGFIVAHFVHNVPANKQRKWRGMLLVPWVIPPAMSTLAWLWLFDPSYSAFNYTLSIFGIGPIPWTGDAMWARFSVILVNVWYGAPFFMIMYLAALKSVPEQLYEAAAIDGANWWQKFRYITWPSMQTLYITCTLLSMIWTLGDFNSVYLLTGGGPGNATTFLSQTLTKMAVGQFDLGPAAAFSLVYFLIILLVSWAFYTAMTHNDQKR